MRTHGRLRFWMLVSKLSQTWFSKSVLMKATDPATEMLTFTRNFFRLVKSLYTFIALTLLVGHQEEHLVCKNWAMMC